MPVNTPDFIAELVRAANEVKKLPYLEKGRLLQRAIVTIRDGRDHVEIRPSGTTVDAVVELQTIAAAIDRRTDDEVKTALLEAANMIRTLQTPNYTETSACSCRAHAAASAPPFSPPRHGRR
jgi:hypothetical protein